METDHLPNQESKPRRSNLQVDERAAEAQAILDNSVFKDALNDVYSRALGTLLNADVGSLTASTAHATMKAIRDVKKQLEDYITDKKMRERFNK
jgi:tRNA(Arg) A34 adenosine deaminase TadA